MALNSEQKALLGALLAISRGERPTPTLMHQLLERDLATSDPIGLTDAGEHATSDLLVEDTHPATTRARVAETFAGSVDARAAH